MDKRKTIDMITVRIANTTDAALIAEMSRQTFYDTFAAANTKEDMDIFMNEQFTTEKLVAEVSVAGNIFLLAYDGDEAVGYVRMHEGEPYAVFNNQPAIEVVRIYATKAAIGKGVGKALMQTCIAIAREQHKKIIWLGVWEHNERAIEFYAKWGFEKFDTHDFVLGKDVQTDWLLMKTL
jgi:diamine N-acetyltransferase